MSYLPFARHISPKPFQTQAKVWCYFWRDCDVIQEKTDELTDLVKGLHSRLDAQKQAKIDALQDKVKEYEKEMDRLRDLIGWWNVIWSTLFWFVICICCKIHVISDCMDQWRCFLKWKWMIISVCKIPPHEFQTCISSWILLSGEESEKENELESLRERNRQLALNLRDSQADLEGAERKNSILTGVFVLLSSASSTLLQITCWTRSLHLPKIYSLLSTATPSSGIFSWFQAICLQTSSRKLTTLWRQQQTSCRSLDVKRGRGRRTFDNFR